MEIVNKISNGMKIAIVYSYVKREFFPTEAQYITEATAEFEAELIAKEIQKLGAECIYIPADDYLVDNLKKFQPEMVFNLVNSIRGLEYLTSAIPGILDILDIPFTGTGLLGMAVCCNKFLTKKLLQSAGIPVPNFQLFHTPNDKLDIQLRFPLISKLNEIHGGVEITEDAISENEKHLRERLNFLIKTYQQPVLVEEFIAGREIVGYVLHGSNTKFYLAEKIFSEHKKSQKYTFVTFDDQWGSGKSGELQEDVYHYEKFDDSLLKEYVRRAFDITDMLDYAKFDVRLDASGRYYFIDTNANPAFGPKELETAMGYILQDLYGISFQEILRRLITNTMGIGEENGNGNGNGSNGHAPALQDAAPLPASGEETSQDSSIQANERPE